jgi:hypothetical protein
MARTRFSGPVASDNGFEGNLVSGTVSTSALSATVLTAVSATLGNVVFSNANAASGAVSAQLGYIPVLVGSTTAYIALYQSVTV